MDERELGEVTSTCEACASVIRGGASERLSAYPRAGARRKSELSLRSGARSSRSLRIRGNALPTGCERWLRVHRRCSWRFREWRWCSSIGFPVAQEAIELRTQFQSRTEQPRFYGGNGNPHRLRGLFGREFFNIAEHEDRAEVGVELIDHFIENLVQFRLRVALLGAWSPVFDFARDQIVFALDRFVERNLIRTALAQAHQRFVGGDAYQPGVKARIFLE